MIAYIDHHMLTFLLGTAAVLTYLWLVLLRDRLRIQWWTALILSILHVLYGVFCVKVFAIVEAGFDMSIAGAMSLFGGVFFMPIAYWLGAKLFSRSYKEVFDIFTIPLVFTLLLARINCLHAGCCYGMPIPGGNGLRWPTREAELLFYAVFLFFVGRRVWNKEMRGTAFPVYMASYGLFRMITETFRYKETNSLLHLSHLWAFLSFSIGLSIYYEMIRRDRVTPQSVKKRRERENSHD